MGLTSSNPVASVPTTVTVPEGLNSTTFPITTATVAATTLANVTAAFGTTRTATLNVVPCSEFVAEPPVFGDETVWFDDVFPTGSSAYGDWQWDTTQKASGNNSHVIVTTGGYNQQYFATYPAYGLNIETPNDVIVAYVMLDPCNPPQEIMLQYFDGNYWEHRAYWGANLINFGADGTTNRQRMGDLPPVGVWTRLAVPASAVGMAGKNMPGMAFGAYGGRAWFDRAGMRACSRPVAAAPSLPDGDVVWFDDALPPGVYSEGPWIWDSVQKASGTQSHTEPRSDGITRRLFAYANPPLQPGPGDSFVLWALVDPCDPPQEIMIQWFDGGWEHRAYWGADLIPWGTPGTPGHQRLGDLPQPGTWTRLVVPAALVDAEGHAINGMTFDLYGGKAWFDRVGYRPAGAGAVAAPAPPASGVSRPGFGASPAERIPVSLGVTARPVEPGVTSGGAVKQYYIYSPELNLIAETDLAAQPSLSREYVWFGGQPIAQVETPTGTVHFYFNDHLGTPLLTTDATGVVDWRVEREPYGRRYATRIGFDRDQPLAFPGQEERNSSPEIAYNIFRWYRAGWGQYTQADPIGLHRSGGIAPLNLIYAYADASPLRFFDPRGLKVATNGCTASQDAAIQKAAGQAEAGALKCLSCKETADVGAWKWVIRHSTYHCSSSPAKACALAEDPSGVVTGTDVILFPYGFDNQSPSECGCLQANILHEAFHNLLRDGGYAEKEIDERVKKCFSCGQNP